MSGNGQTIGMIATITAIALATTLKVLHPALTMLSVVGVGTATQTTVVLLIAATPHLLTLSTIWASAQCLSHSSKESGIAIIEQVINPVS